MKTCFGKRLPGIDLDSLSGTLIVIEGPDSVGRTTQIKLISDWLEEKGYAVVRTGLTRSKLAGRALQRAKRGNTLSQRTLSLFYATDFYDQLENTIIPALRSGLIVLADRYIYTLIARDLVRGVDREWTGQLYSMAVVPQVVFYLDAPARVLIERTLTRYHHMNYWEAGMDLGLSSDWYDSFIGYQKRLRGEFLKLKDEFGFQQINANRGMQSVFADVKRRIGEVIVGSGEKP
jgi:dTMP kinase